jgi:hypothetical protein
MPITEKPKGLTLRKLALAKSIFENRGKKPDGQLMREAGYSPAYSTNPQQLKATASWDRIMKKWLPDAHVAKRHREALDAANEVEVFDKKGRKYKKLVPDQPIRLRAAELAYKVKGRLRDNVLGDNSGSEEIEAIILRVKRMFPESK